MSALKKFRPIIVDIDDIPKEVRWYRKRLQHDGQSENTVESYCWTLRNYLTLYDGVMDADNLLNYKVKMIETMAPASVNCRVHGINRYLKEKDISFRLKTVKVQPKQFLENVISYQDYKHLKRMLKRDNKLLYFLVTGIATSGARISEILTLKTENVYDSMFSVYGKGTKHRTMFLTTTFQKECMDWLRSIGREDGYIFSETGEEPISHGQARSWIKKCGKKYNISEKVLYPHSFRHLFGKMYMQNGGDLVTLASIMGHSRIETTKIYLLVSLEEARAQYNRIVKW